MLSYPNLVGASYNPKDFQNSFPSLPYSTIIYSAGERSYVCNNLMWFIAAFLYSCMFETGILLPIQSQIFSYVCITKTALGSRTFPFLAEPLPPCKYKFSIKSLATILVGSSVWWEQIRKTLGFTGKQSKFVSKSLF